MLPKNDVILTLYQITAYTGRLILDNYLLYRTIKPLYWGELHSLFRFAHAQGLHTVPVWFNQQERGTVEQAYMRALLLGAINPYRLMHGEAAKVYQQLGEWSHHCHMLEPATDWRPNNELMVRLNSQQPARHIGADEQWEAREELRILDIDELKMVIQRRVEEAEEEEDERPVTALARRLQRDMFHRLVNGWKSRSNRENERISCVAQAQLALGLQTCHGLFGGDRLHQTETKEDEQPLSGLSLMPKEEELDELQLAAWASRKQKAGAASGFKVDDPNADIWDKKSTLPTAAEEEQAKGAAIHTLVQTDLSRGGASFYFEFSTGLQPRVGSLIGFRSDEDAGWNLGAIRWMLFSGASGGEFGVKALAQAAIAVSTKALKGVGKGSDHLQGLLLGGDDFTRPGAQLVLPAAIYDEGTVLFVRTPTQERQLRLLKLHDSSESFSCYTFEPLT